MTTIGPLRRPPEPGITSLHNKLGGGDVGMCIARLSFKVIPPSSAKPLDVTGISKSSGSQKFSYLVFRVEQFQLVVHQGVLRALLLSQCALFLQLGTPEGFDRVHRGAGTARHHVLLPCSLLISYGPAWPHLTLSSGTIYIPAALSLPPLPVLLNHISEDDACRLLWPTANDAQT